MKRLPWLIAAVVTIVFGTWGNPVFAQRVRNIPDDPVALGQPLSYWIQVVRDRNEKEIGEAFAAMVLLGPAASSAVPELIRIVEEPFTPIDLTNDTRYDVSSKLRIILMKAGAVDSLGAIGERAARAAGPVLKWSLTVRVAPVTISPDTTPDPLFVELVTMDVLERMRGAGSVAQFGSKAAGPVQKLMESGNAETRKLAVAILNEGALPIVKDLMTSSSCRDRVLGLSMLADMWPVVPEEHLRTLKSIFQCGAEAREAAAAGTRHDSKR
jgi:hypothetical protein